jgi:hypothetical protein
MWIVIARYAKVGTWLRATEMVGSSAIAAQNIGVYMAQRVYLSTAMAPSCYSTAHLGFITATLGEFRVAHAIRTRALLKVQSAKQLKKLVLIHSN